MFSTEANGAHFPRKSSLRASDPWQLGLSTGVTGALSHSVLAWGNHKVTNASFAGQIFDFTACRVVISSRWSSNAESRVCVESSFVLYVHLIRPLLFEIESDRQCCTLQYIADAVVQR